MTTAPTVGHSRAHPSGRPAYSGHDTAPRETQQGVLEIGRTLRAMQFRVSDFVKVGPRHEDRAVSPRAFGPGWIVGRPLEKRLLRDPSADRENPVQLVETAKQKHIGLVAILSGGGSLP
jgi:hypothetical protein